MKRRGSFRRRVLIGATGLTCVALTASVVFAAAGKPGNFKLAPTSPETLSGDRAQWVVAAKLDDKPGTDLALVNDFAGFAVLSGSRTGDFEEIDSRAIEKAPGGWQVSEITAADLDGQNGNDLAVAFNNGPGHVAIYFNDGTGDFGDPEYLDGANVGVTSADLDRDEDIDLATGGSIFLNDGSGDFTAGDSFAGIGGAEGPLDNADLNDDDAPDLVWADGLGETAMISLNDGDGNFTDGVPLTGAGAGQANRGIAVGRIDGDNSPDIAIGKQDGVHLFLNDGAAGFTPSPKSPVGSGRDFNDITIFDVDRDGRSDILAGEYFGAHKAMAVFMGRPNGRFKEPSTSPELVPDANSPPWLAVGKFDRGRYLDVAAATGDGGLTSAVSILLNGSP